MKYKKITNGYVIRLFAGEKVLEVLTKFCVEKDIRNGTLEGIGAVSAATIGYYDLAQKKYHFTQFDQVIYELVSLTGNIALVDEAPFLHIHASIADQKLQMFGGHVQEMVVGVTVEVILTKFDGSIVRELDEKIGLKLLQLDEAQ